MFLEMLGKTRWDEQFLKLNSLLKEAPIINDENYVSYYCFGDSGLRISLLYGRIVWAVEFLIDTPDVRGGRYRPYRGDLPFFIREDSKCDIANKLHNLSFRKCNSSGSDSWEKDEIVLFFDFDSETGVLAYVSVLYSGDTTDDEIPFALSSWKHELEAGATLEELWQRLGIHPDSCKDTHEIEFVAGSSTVWKDLMMALEDSHSFGVADLLAELSKIPISVQHEFVTCALEPGYFIIKSKDRSPGGSLKAIAIRYCLQGKKIGLIGLLYLNVDKKTLSTRCDDLILSEWSGDCDSIIVISIDVSGRTAPHVHKRNCL